jgi:hypothetical protein
MRASAVVLLLVAVGAPAYADRPWTGYIRVPQVTAPAAAVSSRLIYMKRCPLSGCAIHFNPTDDARTQNSSIAQGDRVIGAFTRSDTVWADLMACMRTTYAPFDIGITDVDPGSSVPHFEEIVGGRASDLRNDIPNAGGVAPFTCSEIPNAISFTFDVYGPDALALCWTAAQETAHGFGLEHEVLQKDPMTYMAGLLPKMFQSTQAPCGEFMVRPCQCPGRTTQSSYQMIFDLFGAGVPTPPDVAITQPANGKKVQPGFEVRATATDDVAVDRVELYIDGAMTAMSKTVPYAFTAPALPQGSHSIEVRAYDVQQTPASATIAVNLGPPCTAESGCDHPDVCVMGQCIAGPDQPGGLGAICQDNNECLSHQCADGGEPLKHCVATCDGNAATCPNGFDCLAAGAMNVCYPNPGGGCCDAGSGPGGPLLLGLCALAFVLRPRSRRS